MTDTPTPHTQNTGELEQRLQIFQDYTASWGYPMNQEAHERGLKIVTKDIEALIRTEAYRLASEVIGENEKYPKLPLNSGMYNPELVTRNNLRAEQRTRLQSLVKENKT